MTVEVGHDCTAQVRLRLIIFMAAATAEFAQMVSMKADVAILCRWQIYGIKGVFQFAVFFFYFLETETVSFHFVVLVWMREFFALNLVLCQTDEKTEYDYTLTASTAATISPLKERFFAFLR